MNKNKITNYCKKCEAWCCYDGVYLDDNDINTIKNVVECNKSFFYFLPEDYIVLGNWENKVSGLKTNIKPKEYKSKSFPKHFNQTSCVFLKNNKCMLEVFAVLQGEEPWKYKPKTCCIFPLQKNGDKYIEPSAVEDDCNLGEKYPGFVSCLPCYNLKRKYFNKEFQKAEKDQSNL